MSKKNGIGSNEQIIENAIRKFPDEQIRVQLKEQYGKMGYAVEVTRLIFEEEYSYVGWISFQAFKLEPWPIDQRHMIDRSFDLAVKDAIKEKGN